MMFGTRDEFPYWKCSACGCIQVVEIPKDLGKYYPDDYYTFSLQVTPFQLWMYRYYYRAPRLARLVRRAGVTFQSVLNARPKPGARILDVGCGSGKLVTILRSLGFDAHGVDPFVKVETDHIHRGHLEDLKSKKWDLVMFHHSLEHMSGHIDVLRIAREKLTADGMCLVRIPLVNWAWQHYKENWVQLDAPRHLILHTPQSFDFVTEAAGFKIVRTEFDSGPFQFYGSELYQRNIPLVQKNSEGARFGKLEMRRFAVRSNELNGRRLGDQASFYLKSYIE
jgi:SAM-dependent methyltransferase